MAEIVRHIRTAFVRVWRDEQGAEGLEKLLILALLIPASAGHPDHFRQRHQGLGGQQMGRHQDRGGRLG